MLYLPTFGAVSVQAQNSMDAVVKAETFIDGIVAHEMGEAGASDIQAWIDGALTDGAGTNAEWFMITLAQSGEYDFSKYEAQLLSYLEKHEIHSASSRQKYALALSAIGSTDSYISAVLNNSIGKQGIMSYIFGLHLLNNGYQSDVEAMESVIDTMLSYQCEDGGWSLTGEFGEVDVTAMALQALSPHREEANVKKAIEKAISFLAIRQTESGDYTSYGVKNSESAAQVIVALSSLGIDFGEDERFIKNGESLFDVIERYRLADGSFCHTEGGASNATATVQVYHAMVSYLRMVNGKTPLYILDKADPQNVEPAPVIPDDTGDKNEGEQPNTDIENPNEPQKASYKPWAILAILSFGAVMALVFFILKKRNYKNFLAILLIVTLGIIIVLVTDFRSAEDYYGGEGTVKENVIGSVTMTIRCDTVVGKSDSAYIPDDGIILAVTEFDIAEGETVYDVLVEATRKYRIQMENEGGAEMAYIAGIAYLYELDFGDLSGWVYHVNGESLSVGCGEYKLSDGDIIEWHYTCNLGKDIK